MLVEEVVALVDVPDGPGKADVVDDDVRLVILLVGTSFNAVFVGILSDVDCSVLETEYSSSDD